MRALAALAALITLTGCASVDSLKRIAKDKKVTLIEQQDSAVVIRKERRAIMLNFEMKF